MPKDIKIDVFDVEETFLIPASKDVIESKIRRRGKNDSYTYVLEQRFEQDKQRIQKKRQITAREYIGLLEQQDPNKQKICKKRQTFIFNSL